MYSKFDGTNIEAELEGYGNINLPALILSWNPLEISNFFKKVFLYSH